MRNQFVFLLILLFMCSCEAQKIKKTDDAQAVPALPQKEPVTPLLRIIGLQTPESFQFDPQTKHYFISNIVGAPAARNGNAYISRLTEKGEMDIQQFIIGLDTPAGIAFWQNYLFVADLDKIKGFDPGTGQKIFELELKSRGARFLNDVAAAKDRLYISDIGAGMIVEIVPDLKAYDQSSVKIYRDPLLEGPNGMSLHPVTGRLTIVTWQSGRILELDNQGKFSIKFDHKFKNLDGAAYDSHGNLYVSDFTMGSVYRIDPQSGITTVVDQLTTPADISLGPQESSLLIPLFKANQVIAWPLK